MLFTSSHCAQVADIQVPGQPTASREAAVGCATADVWPHRCGAQAERPRCHTAVSHMPRAGLQPCRRRNRLLTPHKPPILVLHSRAQRLTHTAMTPPPRCPAALQATWYCAPSASAPFSRQPRPWRPAPGPWPPPPTRLRFSCGWPHPCWRCVHRQQHGACCLWLGRAGCCCLPGGQCALAA